MNLRTEKPCVLEMEFGCGEPAYCVLKIEFGYFSVRKCTLWSCTLRRYTVKFLFINMYLNVLRDYDYERRESMKLSAKLKSQKGDIAKADEFEKKCQEFKEINEKMKAERDESLTELEDLKDWTEALKARYDLLVEEYLQVSLKMQGCESLFSI